LLKIHFAIILGLGIIGLGFRPAFAQPAAPAKAAVPEVEWYPLENETSRLMGRIRVIISGKTTPNSFVQIDGDSVTILKEVKQYQIQQQISSVEGKATAEGFFEVAMDLPQGLIQLPVSITTPEKTQKTFLLTFEVNAVKKQLPLDLRTSQQKPPSAAKKIRLWAGAGWTYQGYNQTNSASSDLKFQTIQAPGIVVRGGYWGDSWGMDLYFRDAPGKIQADAPLQVPTENYHWRTIEAKGLYQLDRNAKSRMLGLASQWQIRFGAQAHDLPFLVTEAGNVIHLEQNSFTMATLGFGLLLGQEQKWTYEFAMGAQYPVGVKGPGESFKATKNLGYEVQLGAAYKFAPQWRLGIFSYSQSLGYDYEYKKEGVPVQTGHQSIFYSTFDLRLGFEF
jgi:hypothetical protein